MKYFSTANSAVAAVLGLIGCILTLLVVSNYSTEIDMSEEGLAQAEAAQSYIGMAITYTLYLTGAALLLFVLGLMVFGLIIRPKRMLPLYGGIVGLLIVFGISWSMSSGDIPLGWEDSLTESVSHWSGAGLYMVYILSALAVASIGWSMVSKLVR